MLRPRPRESVFAGGPELYRGDNQALCSPSLFSCVNSLDDICAEAYDAQQLLRNGTFDLPRMARTLSSHRVFLLVNESIVRQYKSELTEEIEPQILELIERAKKGMRALERREQAMQAKLAQAPSLKAATQASASSRLETRRLQSLANQRQRLERELHSLQDDVEALERQAMG